MKKAITQQDIDKLQTDGELVVTRDMVLTPGAREYATRQGISIRYGNSQPAAPAQPIGEAELARLIEQIVVEEMGSAGPASAPAAAPAPVPEKAAMETAGGAEVDEQCMQQALSLGRDDTANRAIVTVVGHDRPGVVSRVSAVVAECGGNLEDISQVVLDKYFTMIFIVNLDGLEAQNLSFRLFKEKLQDEAARLGHVQVLVMHEDIFKAMHKV